MCLGLAMLIRRKILDADPSIIIGIIVAVWSWVTIFIGIPLASYIERRQRRKFWFDNHSWTLRGAFSIQSLMRGTTLITKGDYMIPAFMFSIFVAVVGVSSKHFHSTT
jgi:hypothetical protein